MTWQQDLEIVVARTRVERYRELCADEWPDHEFYRAEMVRMASEPFPLAPRPVEYPSIERQASNLFRTALGWARSGFKLAPKEVRRARLAICEACEWYDATQKRCTQCGCVNSAKVWIASDQCPLDPSKWPAI